MNKTTDAIVSAALNADETVTVDQRSATLVILKGELSELSYASGDLMEQVVKLLGTVMIPKAYIRRQEAAEYLGCSPRFIDLMMHDGRLSACRLGGRMVVFRREAFDGGIERSGDDVGETRGKAQN